MIAGIILAAGFSKRFGGNKLLAEVNGVKMIERVIKACNNSSLDRVLLIYRNEEIKNIGEKYNIETFYNNNAHLGQSASVKLGVEKAENSSAYMFVMGDQPFITSKLINKLVDKFKNNRFSITVPCYEGKNGNPVTFSSIYREDFLTLQGDKGGRDIIKENTSSVGKVYIDNSKLGLDIDNREGLERLSDME